ncbi:MAG: circularly permuted type 2 ATP-grasp protein [Halioglobus sp.]
MLPREQNNAVSSAQSATPPYDEAYGLDGSVRPHWQYLLDSLEELGAEEFQRRHDLMQRILRDDGATYNDYAEGLVARPWALDPIPLLIDSQEWNEIESGLQERAELLNLILRDLYGARSLLKHGVLPPELILSHPGFLRECDGLLLAGDAQLVQYAADMVRAPDGSMQVMSDRTQTPSGAGYALENRLVMSRIFPSLFRDSHVHRLSLYFNSLRLKLGAMNPNGDVGRVAVLTPGTYNETYFEHVFLANFLGYQLVQGSDLIVRDGYVWLKTLDGVSRVDVILRRIDDSYCDPVELKSDSRLGVPGLLEVMRMGHVAIVNPLGSGILENRGLMRYLPAAAQHFFGRELRLQSAATYWCGDPQDRRFVLDNLQNLVIKTTRRSPSANRLLGSTLTAQQLQELRAAIEARPLDYVAQEHLQPSAAPVWEAAEKRALPAVLRGFAVAGESSYTVMPGGLTRVGTRAGEFEISNRLGSLSKDTWVLASEPERRATPEATSLPQATSSSAGTMELPSRVVENLFWVGRYTERAEAALRLLRTVMTKLHGEESIPAAARPLLLRAVTQLTCTYPGFMDDKTLGNSPDDELLSVVLDAKRAGSVVFSLRALQGAVDQVKDYMSADTQRILNELQDAIDQLPASLCNAHYSASEEALGSLVTILLALAGLAKESMVRGHGWTFLDMGRRIERGLQTVSLLRSLWVPALDPPQQSVTIETALLSTESLMTFRRRYQGDPSLASGLDLLLLAPDNPRSLCFQLERIGEHLESLPPGSDGSRLSGEARLVLEATTAVRLANPQLLTQVKKDQYLRGNLDQLLARIQRLLNDTASLLHTRYFEHASGPQPMTPAEQERVL